MKVTLKQLRKDAKKSKLKVGDRVVFLPMGGIWADLQWKTGVIKKKNKDPVWMFDVEIDMPHLLYPDATHMRKNDFITCVGPGAVVSLSQIVKEDIGKLNGGYGPDGILPKMSKEVAHRKLWEEILKMSKGKDANARKMLDECTQRIEKMRKAGVVEPKEASISN